MRYVFGPSHSHLASIFVKDNVPIETRRFPDGEIYVRVLEDLSNQDVCLVQNTWPSDNIAFAVLLQDAIIRMKPKSLSVIFPYFGYARQNRVFHVGEANGASVMGMIIPRQYLSNTNRISCFTIDVHKPLPFPWFKDLSAVSLITDFFKGKVDVVIAPDDGARYRAKNVAESLGISYDVMVKHRIDGSHIEVEPKFLDVKGKRVLVIDDMISTGSTMLAAVSSAFEQGAEEVFAACTHAVYLLNQGNQNESKVNKIIDLVDGLVVTDTVAPSSYRSSKVSVLSIAPMHRLFVDLVMECP